MRPLGWIVVALAGLCAGCRGSRAASDTGSDAGVQAGTAVATVQAFPDLVSAIGTVVPRPGRFAELAAPLSPVTSNFRNVRERPGFTRRVSDWP